MSVFAPFRFARINRWVHFPEWGPLVSHDVPFKDGLSGEIELEIKAETPLLVGGARRKPKGKKELPENQHAQWPDGKEGEVWPYQLPNGRFAIPPSALQGLIRSILEIATFARLGPWIEDKRFGIRDLTRPAEPYYQRRLNAVSGKGPIKVDPNVRAGWLRRKEDGAFELRVCAFGRIEYDDLRHLLGIPEGPVPRRNQFPGGPAGERAFKLAHEATKAWQKKSDADERYGWPAVASLRQTLYVEDHQTYHDHRIGTPNPLSIAYRKVSRTAVADSSQRVGRIILTGNPSDPPKKLSSPSKHLEFFFFDEKTAAQLTDFKAKFEEFLAIHQPGDGRPENPNWAYFRERGYPGGLPFKSGGWMPIFYLPDENGGIESFGLAFMFKLAHEATTHQLLNNSAKEHNPKQRTNELDLPSLILGAVADKNSSSGLKRRASFDAFIAPAGLRPIAANGPTVLLGPKPSYFPLYVRQPKSEIADQLDVVFRDKTTKQFTRRLRHTRRLMQISILTGSSAPTLMSGLNSPA